MSAAAFKLVSYRVLFNRKDHGYYLATIKTSLFDDGNIVNYVKAGEPGTRYSELPLILDPEAIQTVENSVQWNLGRVRGTSSISFNLTLHNCIERERFDQAFFDNGDPSIQQLRSISDLQQYFGTKIPMYLLPDQQLPEDSGPTYSPIFQGHPDPWKSANHYDAKGNRLATTNTYNGRGQLFEPGDDIYPNGRIYVHTGVHVGNLDPQPGGYDYTDTIMTPEDHSLVELSSRGIDLSSGKLPISGKGYRRGAIIYPYSIDLIFEVST